jgi:hypothetical protein
LKSLPLDDTHAKRHPIRFLNASICGSVAREIAANDTSRVRWPVYQMG